MNHGSAILALLGRILLASIFVYSGFGKITDFQGTAGYIASARMPMPQVLAVGAIVVEFIGGLALLIGFRARWAALAFVVFHGLLHKFVELGEVSIKVFVSEVLAVMQDKCDQPARAGNSLGTARIEP